MVQIDWRPDTKQLRRFGLIAFAVFGLLGGVIRWKGGLPAVSFGETAPVVASVLWGVGILSAILSLVAPRANLFLYRLLVVVTYPIGFVVSFVLMALVFYGIITPVGLIFRVLRRDPLNRRFDGNTGSYWVPHHQVEELERYFKQF